MHWGHVKSQDLVHWQRLPIALAPSEQFDRDGCFSRSSVDDDGVLTLIYTGNVWLNEEQTELQQFQYIATSTDGVHFEKDATPLALPEMPFDCQGHLRDPKVWKQQDAWYMILGTREGDQGKAVLYKSQDLRQWAYIGVVAESDGTLGYMWECPDLFHLAGKDVLLFSPQGMESQGDRYNNLHQTGYLVGDLDDETGKFEHGAFEELDRGFDFYASQTFQDEQGRRLVIGWMDMWESQMPTQEQGWAGALTIPRVLEMTLEHKLLMKPVPELELLRGERTHAESFVVPSQIQECVLRDVRGECLEIKAEFLIADCDASAFGIKVRCSEDGREETIIRYDVKQSTVSMDRSRSGAGEGGIRRAPLEMSGKPSVTLHVFVDRSSVELFVNDGEVVMTSRIYPHAASDQVALFAENGSVHVMSWDSWNVKEIWEQEEVRDGNEV